MIYTFKLQNEIFKVHIEEEGQLSEIEIDDKKFPVEFKRVDDNLYSLIIEDRSFAVGILKRGKTIEVYLNGELYEFEATSSRDIKTAAAGAAEGIQEIKSPMPSSVVKVLKGLGEAVKEGESVIVVEAMKMESELKSPIAGKVKEVNVEPGNAVESGTVLLVISSEE
ncbi:MAG: biotin/lipoyl-containing protein [Thermodesulfobacteriota bacterium]